MLLVLPLVQLPIHFVGRGFGTRGEVCPQVSDQLKPENCILNGPYQDSSGYQSWHFNQTKISCEAVFQPLFAIFRDVHHPLESFGHETPQRIVIVAIRIPKAIMS